MTQRIQRIGGINVLFWLLLNWLYIRVWWTSEPDRISATLTNKTEKLRPGSAEFLDSSSFFKHLSEELILSIKQRHRLARHTAGSILAENLVERLSNIIFGRKLNIWIILLRRLLYSLAFLDKNKLLGRLWLIIFLVLFGG